MSRAAFVLILVSLVPALAWADDEVWVKALHKEFEERDMTWAAKLYRELGDERATYRLIEVVAKANQPQLVEVEAKRFLERFPGSKLRGRVEEIAKAPPRFVEALVRNRDTERKRVLRDTKLTLDFAETPLREALEQLSDMTGLAFVLLPEVDPSQSVTAKLADTSARSALRLFLAPLGFSHEVSLGAVVVGKSPTQVRPPAFRPRVIRRNPEGYLALKAMRVSLSFARTPLRDALEFMKSTTGQAHTLAAGIDPATPISLLLKDVSFEEALTLLSAQLRASYVLVEGGVQLRPVE